MLKELFELIKGNASESVINNPDVPNERNDEVVAEGTNTVASGLRNIVAGGGLQSLINMFTAGNQNKNSLMSNPIVSMMIGHLTGKLVNKFNMNPGQANNISSGLIPDSIGNLINKVNDPNDNNFSLEKLLASITGGKSQEVTGGNGLQDILSQFTGNNQSDANGGGLMDLIKGFAGAAQEQQARNGGGGLLDLIKGFTR